MPATLIDYTTQLKNTPDLDQTGLLVGDGLGGISAVSSTTAYQKLRRKANIYTGVSYEFVDDFLQRTNDYNFTLTAGSTITGDLSSPGTVTVTLSSSTICPSGLNGNDSDHRVYISNGTGTPEAVLISGAGTARAGVAGGTLIFTTVYSHTGSWTITSATAGFQEAVQAAGSTSIIEFPPGDSLFYATGTVPVDKDLEIRGAGPCASKIKSYQASGDTIYILGNTFGIASVHNLLFYPQMAKSSGIELRIDSVGFLYLRNLHFTSAYDALTIKNCNTIHYSNLNGNNCAHGGVKIWADAAATSVLGAGLSLGMSGATGVGLEILAATGGVVTAVNLVDTVLQNGATNVKFYTTGTGVAGESNFANLEIDSAFTSSIVLTTPTRGNLFGINFTNVRGGSSRANVPIIFATLVCAVKFNNLSVNNGATENGIVLAGCQTASISNSLIGGSQYSIYITVSGATVCDNIQISNNQIGFSEVAGTTGSYGIATSADAHTNIYINGNTVAGSSAALDWHATGLGSRLGFNIWVGGLTKPDAATYGAALKGSVWFTEGGAGVADTLEVLSKDTGGSYAWRTLI